MHTLHWLFTVGLLIAILAGGTAAIGRWIPFPLARVAAILFVVLPLFALEHAVGLGELRWAWPLLTVAALYVLWRRRSALLAQRFGWDEVPFWAAFGGALIWRHRDPNIDPTGENLTDLYFIANYLPGDRLPPPDQWLGCAQPFDFYYGLQHYAAALLARVFALPGGYAMNLAFCLLVGLAGSLAWFAAREWGVSRRARALLVGTLLVGGSGLALPVQFSLDLPSASSAEKAQAAATYLWSSTRWSGSYEERINTPFGEWLFRDPRWNDPELAPMDLPLETFLYYGLVGDFHPPLGGFLVLLFSLALMATLTARPTTRVLTALLATTPALALGVNAWVFPLQAALVGAWFLQRSLSERHLAALWQGAAVGIALSGLCLLPFLASFGSSALSPYPEWVPISMHTRGSILLSLTWPWMLGVLALLLGRVRDRWTWTLVVFIAISGTLSEVFFFDDPLSGVYERFNTTLKIWSWLFVATIAGLVPAALASHSKVARGLTIVLLLGLLLPGLWNATGVLRHTDFPHSGRWSGDGWLRDDPAHSQLLDYLRHRPPGVVLEYPHRDAYSSHTALALFAEKPSVIGWSATQQSWRGGSTLVAQRAQESRQFFTGELSRPLDWLTAQRVDYILWTRQDALNLAPHFTALSERLKPAFEFKPFAYVGDTPIGLWQRRRAVEISVQ